MECEFIIQINQLSEWTDVAMLNSIFQFGGKNFSAKLCYDLAVAGWLLF